MATFLSILFWVFLVLSILLIWSFFDDPFTDGTELFFIVFAWIVYGFLYLGVPVETTSQNINDFHYKKTESGMHVMYGEHNQFTSDVYLIKNIEDTSKVDVTFEEHFSSSGMKVGDKLVIEKK